MWTLESNWYELVLRAACVFVFLFIVMRIWGRKHFGELTPFDFILLLIMSEAVQTSLMGDDKSLPGGMIVILTMVLLNIALNKMSYKWPKAEKLINGSPIVLVKNGRVDEKMKNKLKISDQEFEEAMRLEGVKDLKNVEQATMESNGHISVIKHQ